MLQIADMGVVADDLTGACDVAACFAAQVGPVVVALTPDGSSGDDGPDLRVINTQSRLGDPQAARQTLRRVGKRLAGKQVVFKKIDTGLRGPIGAELEGLLEGLKQSGGDWSCIVAPAAPSIGRTTCDGVQYDNGLPIDKGALSRDPSAPPLSANVRAAIERTGRVDCQVCDARDQADLQRIVDTHLGSRRVVFAGSLGLALALADRLAAAARTPRALSPVRRPMIVCGSCHPRSVRQVEQARGRGIAILTFDPVKMRFDAATEPSRDEVVLARILPPDAGTKLGSSRQITTAFIAALCPLLERIKPDGLGIVGGETAYHLLRLLEASGLEVYQRRAEVIACARISGGSLGGCPLVCKGGSVGPEDAVLQILSLLTSIDYRKDE